MGSLWKEASTSTQRQKQSTVPTLSSCSSLGVAGGHRGQGEASLLIQSNLYTGLPKEPKGRQLFKNHSWDQTLGIPHLLGVPISAWGREDRRGQAVEMAPERATSLRIFVLGKC